MERELGAELDYWVEKYRKMDQCIVDWGSLAKQLVFRFYELPHF